MPENRAWIAAADPTTVLALLDRLAAAEALLRGAQGWLEACVTIADDEDDAAALVDLDARIAAHLAGGAGVQHSKEHP